MDDIDVGREIKDVTLADEIAAAERSISRGEGMEHDDALRLVIERNFWSKRGELTSINAQHIVAGTTKLPRSN